MTFIRLGAAALLLSAFCQAQVTVAAAANLSQVFPVIGKAFEAETHIHPVFSFASTAQLAQQIENGAPFDVFAAADADHVDRLISKGILESKSRALYATGDLVLWIPPGSRTQIEKLQDLTLPGVHTIAVAKPELAPYGLATVETLRKLGIWDRVQSKIVYASSIGVARQYGTSGNADAVFTARSLLLKDAGQKIPIDEALHAPISQVLGIVSASKNQKAALAFTGFVMSRKGQDILKSYGYK